MTFSKATTQDESSCALKNLLSSGANWNDYDQKIKLRSIMTIRYYYGVVGS